MTKGKNKIREKTKEVRLLFSKSVISGSKSGSGKLVFEHQQRDVSKRIVKFGREENYLFYIKTG